MQAVLPTFQAHYASWLRTRDVAAQAAACQRWENEGGAIRLPARSAPGERR